MAGFIDLLGALYGRLEVVKRIGTKNGSPLWLCNCECGNTTEVITRHLRNGNTKSCGCIHSEQLAQRNYENRTHGDADSRLYGVWHSMKQRCYDKNRKDYKDYGERGIYVCDEWKNDYYAFQKWALENGYNKDAPYMQCTLDRKNGNDPYAPWNCRWVDAKTQANNRRKRNKEVV